MEEKIKRPRGRPRKNPDNNDLVKLLDPDLAKKYMSAVRKKKARLNAVFVDMVYAFDTKTGQQVEINVYRVEPKKKKYSSYEESESEDYTYVGFNAEFIDNLDKDIIPTPLGSADIVEEVDDEEEGDNDFYDDTY